MSLSADKSVSPITAGSKMRPLPARRREFLPARLFAASRQSGERQRGRLGNSKKLTLGTQSSRNLPRASKLLRLDLAANEKDASPPWRVIVIGGHTRSIGKTQLVCDVIAAFPEANWVAGKITQYGHGICAQDGKQCDCAPDEHICAISWEERGDTGTDSARFLAAGASRSFW